VRIVRHLLFAAAAFAAAASLPTASAAQMGGGQPGETIVVNEGPMPAEAGVGQPGGCGCRSVQQPPWHGNVRGAQCGPAPACCRGSSVFQAHPFQQLPCHRPPCTTLPPCLPRLHAMCREGYLPTPVSPVQPRCHQCGAAIEGGF
jgi:hypothetical protein